MDVKLYLCYFVSTCFILEFYSDRPEQPYQVYDENTQRLALRRRLRDDDQWVVPHNLYILATDDIDGLV